MNILAIGCHPDDVEINCAGTLAKCVRRGDRVIVCHACNGNMGHEVIMPDELRLIRAEEARKAGSLAGIEVITADIGDLTANGGDMAQRDKIIEIIRYAQPDLIISHAPSDYMCDHVAVSRLVFDASFAASCPHYRMDLGPASKVTPLYYMDNLGGHGFVPTEYVDITDTFELKMQMLECHESQLKWMREHDNIDFADFVRTTAKYRGLQCGVPYAEAFTQAYVYPKVQAERLLP